MLLEKENIENRASKFYKKISFMQSRIFQGVLIAIILNNLLFMFIMSSTMEEHHFELMNMTHLGFKLNAIVCELAIAYILFYLLRGDERKFNSLEQNGILLNTTIDKNASGEIWPARTRSLRIQSYYICEDETRLVFYQVKSLNINRISETLFPGSLEEILKKEKSINVLVNPSKYNEYFIMMDEIGMLPENKDKAIYGKSNLTKILLLVLSVEYVVWIFCFFI